jgi:hypothetical protein
MPLAKFAYSSNGKGNVQGYNIDHGLTTDNFTCYVNYQKKEAVLAYVETRATRHDLYVLHKLLHGKIYDTHRHKHHMNTAVKFYNKYNHPGWKYAVTGHGLGGRFAMDASAHLRKRGQILPAEAYNPIFSPNDKPSFSTNQYANTITHRDPNDFFSHNVPQVAGGFIVNHEFTESPDDHACPSTRTGNEQPDVGTGTTTPTPPPPPVTKPPPTSGTGTTTQPPATKPPPSDGKTPAKPTPPAQKTVVPAQPPAKKKAGLFSKLGHYLNKERKKNPWEFWGTVVAGTIALGITAVLTGGATLEALGAAAEAAGLGSEAAAGYTAVAVDEAAASAAEEVGANAAAGLDDSFTSAVSSESDLDTSITSESSSDVSDFESHSSGSSISDSTSSGDGLLDQSEYDQEDDALMRNNERNSVLGRFKGSIRDYSVDAIDRIQKLAELQGRPFVGLVNRIGTMTGLSVEMQNAIIQMINTGLTANVSYLIIKNEVVDPVENFIKEMVKFNNDPSGYVRSLR